MTLNGGYFMYMRKYQKKNKIGEDICSNSIITVFLLFSPAVINATDKLNYHIT